MQCLHRFAIPAVLLAAGSVAAAPLFTVPMPDGKARFGASAARAARPAESMPVMNAGGVISCLNKSVVFNFDNRRIVLTADGEELMHVESWYSWHDPVTGKKGVTRERQFPHDRERAVQGVKDGVVYWEGWIRYGNLEWRHSRWEMSLTKDGLVRIDMEETPSPDPAKFTIRTSGCALVGRPNALAGTTCAFADGTTVVVDPAASQEVRPKRGSEDCSFRCFKGDPAKSFGVVARKAEGVEGVSLRTDPSWVMVQFSGARKTLYLDIRKGVSHDAATLADKRANVDFGRLEGLRMPDASRRNLLPNGTFEQGLKGWSVNECGEKWGVDESRWTTTFYELTEDAHAGRYAVRMKACPPHHDQNNYRAAHCPHGWTPLVSMAIPVTPGDYTISYWAKAEGEAEVWSNVWLPQLFGWFHWGYGGDAARIGREWKRYSFKFTAKRDEALIFYFSATTPDTQKEGHVLYDDIQVERSPVATADDRPVAEGRLLTSAPDGFCASGRPIDARVEIVTKPRAVGSLRVRITTFLQETVLDKSYRFEADDKGFADVRLFPAGTVFPDGLWVMHRDYEVDGVRAFETDRFTVAPYLDGTFKNFRLAMSSLADESERSDFHRRMDRHAQLGWGSVSWGPKSERLRLEYEKRGIDPGDLWFVDYVYERNSHTNRYGWFDHKEACWGFVERSYDPKDRWRSADYGTPGIEVSFRGDAKGAPYAKYSDEYFKAYREAALAKARRYPYVKKWQFTNELEAHFGLPWWSETSDEKEFVFRYGQCLKIMCEAIREVIPDAIVMPDAPCNFSENGFLPRTRKIIAETVRQGFRVDAIAQHFYREKPEDPDLDRNFKTLFETLDAHGYPKTTGLWLSEGMMWGPYEIPHWGIRCTSWGAGMWRHCGGVSYDLGRSERRSGAWCLRSWLVAYKYQDRTLGMAGGSPNNGEMDCLYTPRVSWLMPNVLGRFIGNASFRDDIRFAPFTRVYLFEDEKRRPVAFVWGHKDALDFETEDARMATADFGGALEGVYDMLGTPRDYRGGPFPILPYPLVFRGRPGTLDRLRTAFREATIVGGTLSDRCRIEVNPGGPRQMKVRLTDHMTGTVSNFTVATSQTLKPDAPTRVFHEGFGLGYVGLVAKRAPIGSTVDTLDWSRYPQVELTNRIGGRSGEKAAGQPGFRASYRVAWNAQGLFLEVDVTDTAFSHCEYERPGDRWDNDSLQVYLDTYANARANETKGFDKDDYEYGVYPSSDGSRAIAWRTRSADIQLTLGTRAPKDDTEATELTTSFCKTSKGYVYRVFIPNEYALPLAFKKGECFGLGLSVNNADSPAPPNGSPCGRLRRTEMLTNTLEPGKECYLRPDLYPVVVLGDD